MKLKFISNGKPHDYLTDGEVYRVQSHTEGPGGMGAWIANDFLGTNIFVVVKPADVCAHCDGAGHFEIVEEDA